MESAIAVVPLLPELSSLGTAYSRLRKTSSRPFRRSVIYPLSPKAEAELLLTFEQIDLTDFVAPGDEGFGAAILSPRPPASPRQRQARTLRPADPPRPDRTLEDTANVTSESELMLLSALAMLNESANTLHAKTEKSHQRLPSTSSSVAPPPKIEQPVLFSSGIPTSLGRDFGEFGSIWRPLARSATPKVGDMSTPVWPGEISPLRPETPHSVVSVDMKVGMTPELKALLAPIATERCERLELRAASPDSAETCRDPSPPEQRPASPDSAETCRDPTPPEARAASPDPAEKCQDPSPSEPRAASTDSAETCRDPALSEQIEASPGVASPDSAETWRAVAPERTSLKVPPAWSTTTSLAFVDAPEYQPPSPNPANKVLRDEQVQTETPTGTLQLPKKSLPVPIRRSPPPLAAKKRTIPMPSPIPLRGPGGTPTGSVPSSRKVSPMPMLQTAPLSEQKPKCKVLRFDEPDSPVLPMPSVLSFLPRNPVIGVPGYARATMSSIKRDRY